VRITARSQIPQAIQWCIDNKDNYDISIITLSSWYQLGPCDGLCEACKKADDAIEKGIVFVKSAGNQWGGDITCPGSAFNIITVGASDDHGTVTTSDDTVADFSSHGPTEDGRPGLDIVARGVNIIMPALGGGYASSNGTSFAAPHVAGLAALILEKNPNWSPNMVKDAIRNPSNTVDLGYDRNTQGYGLIDALSSVQASPDGSYGWDPFYVENSNGKIKFDITRDKNVIALQDVYVEGVYMLKSMVTPYAWVDSTRYKLTDNYLFTGPRVTGKGDTAVGLRFKYIVGGLDVHPTYAVSTIWIHPWIGIVSIDGQNHDFDILGYYDVDLQDSPNDCPQWTSGSNINNEIRYAGTDQFYVKHRQKFLWWWIYPKPWLRFEPYSLDNPKIWILHYETAGYTYNPDTYLNGEAVWGENIVIYYKAYYDNALSAAPGPTISIIK